MNATQFFQFGHQNQPKRMVQKVLVRIEDYAEMTPIQTIINEEFYEPHLFFSKKMGSTSFNAETIYGYSSTTSEMKEKYKPIFKVENTDLVFEMSIPLRKNTGAETFEVTHFQFSFSTIKQGVNVSHNQFTMKYNSKYISHKVFLFRSENLKNADYYDYSFLLSANPYLVYFSENTPMIYDNEKDIEIVLTKI